MSNGRGWGQDAFAHVSSKTVLRAARAALFDVQTWLPAAGAIVCAASDLDQRVSNWATKHTPLFGSQDTAQNVSDYLRATLLAETFGTMIATPSGSHAEQWLPAKGKGLGVELLAVGGTAGTTEVLKRLVKRSRPDDSSGHSFPSGHASSAFAATTLTQRHLEVLQLSPVVSSPLQAADLLLASSTAWARVESGKHFPSDVLAGAALGHFLSAFIYDALIGLPQAPHPQLSILPSKAGVTAQLSFPF